LAQALEMIELSRAKGSKLRNDPAELGQSSSRLLARALARPSLALNANIFRFVILIGNYLSPCYSIFIFSVLTLADSDAILRKIQDNKIIEIIMMNAENS
jgi:hypothetical protein